MRSRRVAWTTSSEAAALRNQRSYGQPIRPGMGSRTWNGHRPVSFVRKLQSNNSVSSRAARILVRCTFFRCNR